MKAYNRAYAEQLKRWVALCDVHQTPEDLAAIEADQAQRVADMRLAELSRNLYDLFAPLARIDPRVTT